MQVRSNTLEMLAMYVTFPTPFMKILTACVQDVVLLKDVKFNFLLRIGLIFFADEGIVLGICAL